MPKNRSTQTHFLNVDLDIRARSGLRKLLTAMEPKVLVLSYQPRRMLSVETAVEPRTIDEAIRLFSELVDSLEPSDRLIWDRCKSAMLEHRNTV